MSTDFFDECIIVFDDLQKVETLDRTCTPSVCITIPSQDDCRIAISFILPGSDNSDNSRMLVTAVDNYYICSFFMLRVCVLESFLGEHFPLALQLLEFRCHCKSI